MQDKNTTPGLEYWPVGEQRYSTTDGNCEIAAGRVKMSSLGEDILQRLDSIEKRLFELYYPYKTVAKNDQ